MIENYPLEKYRFIVLENKRKVIAISTYAGKEVRGVAKCDPADTFDVQRGKEVAAAKCNLKIQERRAKHASRRLMEAEQYLKEAYSLREEAKDYVIRSLELLGKAETDLDNLH